MRMHPARSLSSLLLMTVALAGAAVAQTPAKPPAAPPAGGPSDAARQAISAAVKAIEASDYATAEKQFVKVTELAPKLPQGWLGLAESRLQLDRPQDALVAAKRARDLAPDLAPASFAVARCLAALGSDADALTAAERAHQLDPANVETAVLNALLLRRLRRDDDASKLLEAAWKAGQRDPRLVEQLAFLRFDHDDLTGAADAARQGLAADPQRANLKLVLGFALAKDPTHRDEAVRNLEEALAAGVGERGSVQLELGGLLLDAGRAADALAHLEEAARLLPERSAAHYRLGQARRALGDAAGAEQALGRYQELEAREHEADRGSKELGIALNEAQELAGTNRLDEALARLDTLHRSHPDDARVAALRAKVLFSMGRRSEAEQSIAEAIARVPDLAEYQYLSALFAMYAGRAGEAQAKLERVLKLDPKLAPAQALLAGALVKQGKTAEALAHFQSAIELGADSPEVRLGYAEALKSLGRAEEAAAQMEAYRKLAARP